MNDGISESMADARRRAALLQAELSTLPRGAMEANTDALEDNTAAIRELIEALKRNGSCKCNGGCGK
jgi:hypothetical protein